MGGRGSSSGAGGKSAIYLEAFNDAASIGNEYTDMLLTLTPSALAYEMIAMKDATGTNIIAEQKNHIKFLQEEVRNANGVYADLARFNNWSEKETLDRANGHIAGLKEQIRKSKKAIQMLESSETRSEYEKFRKEQKIRDIKAKKRKGRWM